MKDKRTGPRRKTWLLELLWSHDVVIFVIAAVSMAARQHDLPQQQGEQRQSFCLTSMPSAICWYWGGGKEKSYGFQLSALLTCLKYKGKSVRGTMVFRSPFCAPGACTPVLTRLCSLQSEHGRLLWADHSAQLSASSAPVTEQSQGSCWLRLHAELALRTAAADWRSDESPAQGGFWSMSAEEHQGVPVSRRNNKILRKSNNKLLLINFITLR